MGRRARSEAAHPRERWREDTEIKVKGQPLSQARHWDQVWKTEAGKIDLKDYLTKEVIKAPRDECSVSYIFCPTINIPVTPLVQVRCCGTHKGCSISLFWLSFPVLLPS